MLTVSPALWLAISRGHADDDAETADRESKAAREGIDAIVKALDAKKSDEVRKLAKETGSKMEDMGPVMELFKNLGIAKKLEDWSGKAPTAVEFAKDAPKMAKIIIAVSHVADAKTPAKKEEDKDPKDWKKWSAQMRKLGGDLADLADKKADPKKVKELANRIIEKCYACHQVFR